jgi:hypothetical protein
MASQAGIDLLRGRPTPAIGTTEAKLQQRKLDALRRGIHRIADAAVLPFSVHVIGLGGMGSRAVEQILRDAPDDLLANEGARLTALTVDIGAPSSDPLPTLAARFPEGRAHVETLVLPVPPPTALVESLRRYRDFLQLESPLTRWDPAYQPWVAEDAVKPGTGQSVSRAVAKAIYGQAYYDGARPAAAALRRFAASLDAAPGDAVVCLVFGLGDAVGSGMAVDVARHLSNAILGRRVLVTGIGIAPCEGDGPERTGAHLFPLLNEIDCMGDEDKNRGVVLSCGDLYKNPFTAGFLLVPQQPVWAATGDLAATQERVRREIASLLTLRNGANLWEMLRLLNWVAAPSTQHSAACTPWGSRWIHVLGYADTDGPMAAGPDLAERLGLLPGYAPEFIEMRMADPPQAPGVDGVAAALAQALSPEVPPVVVGGGAPGSVQFVLPRVSKTDLALFQPARDAYEAADEDERRLGHSLLLERGIVLSEPSTQLDGMAGASLWGGNGWVAVPLAALRGEERAA